MQLRNIGGLIVLAALVACTGAAQGTVAKKESVAPAAPSPVASSPAPMPDAGDTVADMTTKTNDRILRDSYYKCVESNDGSTWDMQSCVEAEFDYQDAKLNTVYRYLMAKLSDAQKEHLRAEERQWISERDSVCTWDANTEGQAQRIEANVCALKKTAERVAELEKALLKVSDQ